MTSLPSREQSRLAALERLQILDSLPEPAYDDLVLLAARLCDTPMALVTLIDRDRQWFKARRGTDTTETPRDHAFCTFAIDRPDEVMIVEDATRDARFAANPLVTGAPGVRFYAGAPIVTDDGTALGTVCVVDTRPRTLDAEQLRGLEALARHAGRLVDLRGIAVEAARAESTLLDRNLSLERRFVVSEREQDRLWELSEDLLVTTSYGGQLFRVSPSWTRLLGYSEETLRATPYRSISHPDDAAQVDDALRRMRRTGAAVSFEDRLRGADGHWHLIAWTLSPEPGHQRVTGIGRDITEERAHRTALEAAESALRQSQKMEAVGQLTGGLAHDFNNLLTGIAGSLELLQLRVRQGRTGELDRYIHAAQGAAKRAAALTHRLLAFARRQTLEAKPTDLNRLIHGMEVLVRRTVGPSIAYEVVGSADCWPAMVDANQLENALLNLCINARDAMPDGGRLTIRTDNVALDEADAQRSELVAGDYVVIGVADSGTGMSPAVVKRAFDPFYTTKPLGVGTGLGLSMVYGFAQQSRGQIRIDSTVGQGTTMRLYLPRHHGAMSETVDAMPDAVDGRTDRGETVLVVDDERTVRMLIVEVLTDLGYRSIEAHDGSSALAVLRSDETVDLLVTDVGLPGGLNGRQVADAARVLRPRLQVLFITGYAESALPGGDALGPGARVLTKPFTVDALVRRVKDSLPERPIPMPG